MRLVFAGTPQAAVPALAALVDSRHEVAAVLTRPPAPSGRGRRLVASPVSELAEQHGIDVLTPRRPAEPEFLDRLRDIGPDCCPVVAYGALLPRVALDIPPAGWVNLHFSLLPAWRGAAPVQHAIRHGDDVTGATTFLIEEGMDTGPVYGTVTERIGPADTAGDLLGRLSLAGAKLLLATLDGIEDGSLQPVLQPADGVSYAPKVDVDHARIDWNHPAVGIDRLVRSTTPSPGAWTTVDGARLKLGPVAIVSEAGPLAAGLIAVTRTAVMVGTGSHPVQLGRVQPEGRPPMDALDWARGARPDGARLA
ncbi:MAG: methionyl-tRNA formyltransferase [Mycobacteriales bacterium]